jgi:acyl carrier protein
MLHAFDEFKIEHYFRGNGQVGGNGAAGSMAPARPRRGRARAPSPNDQETGMLHTSKDMPADRVSRVVVDIALRNGVTKPIRATDGLVDIGLNSIAMVDLMLAIEAAFDVTIPQPDLTPENFRSIASIEAVMARLAVGSA